MMVKAVSRRWIAGLALAAALAVSAGFALAPAARAGFPTTRFEMSVPGHYDAWGRIVWYNRSVGVFGTFRNWEKGACASIKFHTTRRGDQWSPPSCKVGPESATNFRILFKASTLRGGLRGVRIIPANGENGNFLYTGGTWFKRR